MPVVCYALYFPFWFWGFNFFFQCQGWKPGCQESICHEHVPSPEAAHFVGEKVNQLSPWDYMDPFFPVHLTCASKEQL